MLLSHTDHVANDVSPCGEPILFTNSAGTPPEPSMKYKTNKLNKPQVINTVQNTNKT